MRNEHLDFIDDDKNVKQKRRHTRSYGPYYSPDDRPLLSSPLIRSDSCGLVSSAASMNITSLSELVV